MHSIMLVQMRTPRLHLPFAMVVLETLKGMLVLLGKELYLYPYLYLCQ